MITDDNLSAAAMIGPASDAELQATLSRLKTEHDLRAAATTIDDMPDSEVRSRLSQLALARDARSQCEVLRMRVELENLELDEAAYQLAGQAEEADDLNTAAHWYSAAAMNDFADAPLRLARVLDRLATERQAGAAGRALTREESHLVTEAARWYLAAFAAGDIEAAEHLDDLLIRHNMRQRGDTARDAASSDADPSPSGGRPRHPAPRATSAHAALPAGRLRQGTSPVTGSDHELGPQPAKPGNAQGSEPALRSRNTTATTATKELGE